MDNKKLWDSALLEIELNISKANFNTWFKDTYILKQENGLVHLAVPNTFVKTWLFDKYHKFILRSLLNLSEGVRSLEYVVMKDEAKRREMERISGFGLPTPSELPLNDFYVDQENNLNPRYTFESFIVGPFNELAHAAAQAIIQKPGITYNPLFVYGNTGVGKTHLIQAVGNKIKQSFPSKKIYYVTSEKFTMDFVNSIQSNKVNLFKEKYRKYDVLIMDDIQFLTNKEKTQEELFHLFNTLYDQNKQIIFSSDKHPNFIQNLEDRLKSRFAAGMIVDIPAPDHESRMAIIRAKLNQNSITLNDEAIGYLVSTIETNIRELEGVMNAILCQTRLKGRELSLNEIKNLVRSTEKPKRAIAIKDVVKTIADFYNIDESSIYEKTRRKEIVRPRQMAMYILREECSVSYPLIGQKLGGRDHTTVIHSCEKIKGELKINHLLVQEVNQIRSML